jgi:WD40 repeat protein
MRGFEWYHVWKLCNPATRNLLGHKEHVYHIAYSPDGRLLVSTGKDGSIRFWDPGSGTEVKKLEGHHIGEVNWVSFAPDGKTLASCGDDGDIRVWDWDKSLGVAGFAQKGEVVAAEFSSDGTLLASGGNDKRVHIWDLGTQQLLDSLETGSGRIESLAFAPNFGLLAAGSMSGNTTIWRIERTRNFGLKVFKNLGTERVVRALAFNRRGDLLAMTVDGSEIPLFDPFFGRIEKTLPTQGLVTGPSLAFSPDDRFLAAATMKGSIWVGPIAAADEGCFTPADQEGIWCLAYSRDGSQLASAGANGTIRLWDPSEIGARKVLHWHDQSFKEGNDCLCFSPDSRTAVTGSDHGEIAIWRVGEDQPRHTKLLKNPSTGAGNMEDPIISLAFDPDGARVVATSRSGVVNILDVETGTCQVALLAKPGNGSVLFSHDGRTVLRSSNAGVQCWDLGSSEPLSGLLMPAEADYWKLMGSPLETKILAIRTGTGTVRSWDGLNRQWASSNQKLSNRSQIDALTGNRASLFCADFGGCIAHYDLTSAFLDPDLVWSVHDSLSVHSLAISPDGKTLAGTCADQSVRLWNTATGKEICSLDKPPGTINSLKFSPDGCMLAGLRDRSGQVLIWLAGEGSYRDYARQRK